MGNFENEECKVFRSIPITEDMEKLCQLKTGLVLIIGGCGSGKTIYTNSLALRISELREVSVVEICSVKEYDLERVVYEITGSDNKDLLLGKLKKLDYDLILVEHAIPKDFKALIELSETSLVIANMSELGELRKEPNDYFPNKLLTTLNIEIEKETQEVSVGLSMAVKAIIRVSKDWNTYVSKLWFSPGI